MIRDAILDSNHYATLSTEGKLLYIHLLLLADDCGCVGVSETFLRRRAFHDAPSGQKIATLLNELSDADLIRCYDANRACFAFIPRFRQRLQRTTLKHPKPPESLYADDAHAKELFSKIKDGVTIPTVAQPLTNGAPTVPQPPEVKGSEGKNYLGSRFALTVLPDDWVAFCKTERPDLNPARVFVEFRDYWIAVAGAKGRKADWLATWRTWVRRQNQGNARPQRADGLAL